MKIGLNLVPVSLDKLADAARVSEELGFESGWIGEHIVLPMKPRVPYPYGEASFRPDTPFLEPFVALAHLATVTEKLRLGTGICILPGRQFFATARAITTLDNISRGRLDLGVGTGWSEDEFELLGADFHQRGAVMDEFLDALDALWQQQHPSFHGKYLDFDNLGFAPKPVQKPRVPVHVGGFAPAALRRAAVRGDGWYGSAGSPEEARNSIDTINNLLREQGRDPADFEHTIMVWSPPDSATVAAYGEAGAQRLIATPFSYPKYEADPIARIRDFARYCGLQKPG